MPIKKFIINIIILMSINNPSFASCIGINCSCSVAANTLNFGNYNPLSSSDNSISGMVSVTCSALIAGLNVSYTISLNAGSNGNFTTRKMKNSTYLMNYNIFTDGTHTTVWGDGSSGTATISDSYLLNLISVTRNYTLYGQIPGSQNTLGPGPYTDTITVTVSY